MKVRAALTKLHRWAGLGAAVFLVAAGISGAMIAVEGTLLPPSFVAEHNRVEVGEQRAPLGGVLNELQRLYGETPDRVTFRGDPALPDEYRLSRRETVYVDPYLAEIIAHTSDFRTSFSRGVWDFHSSLLLGRAGEWLVLLATGVLLVSLLGGIVLVGYEIRTRGWRALSLHWTGNGKSWNRRAHNLAGVIWAPLLVVIAASSFYRAFPSVEQLTLQALGVPLEAPADPRSVPVEGASSLSPDALLQQVQLFEQYPSFDRVRLTFPASADEPYRLDVQGASGPGSRELVFVDQYTGAPLDDPQAQLRSRRERITGFLFSLHSGGFHGEAVRALWAVASAMLAFFVVSGYLMWRARPRARRGRASASAPIQERWGEEPGGLGIRTPRERPLE